jgi:hypothetical protein
MISFDENLKNSPFTIFEQTGRVVYSSELEANPKSINGKHFNPGMYYHEIKEVGVQRLEVIK